MNSTSSGSSSTEQQQLRAYFLQLEETLEQSVDAHYFEEPRRFKSLVHVIDVLGTKLEMSANVGQEKISLQVLQVGNARNTIDWHSSWGLCAHIFSLNSYLLNIEITYRTRIQQSPSYLASVRLYLTLSRKSCGFNTVT